MLWIDPKNERTQDTILECVSFVFWKNPGLHSLLSRFTDLYHLQHFFALSYETYEKSTIATEVNRNKLLCM